MSWIVVEGLFPGKIQSQRRLFRKASENLDIEDHMSVLLS